VRRVRRRAQGGLERLFTHRWRLEQAEEAYRLFDTQTTGKAVILPS
jgi:threonine dehydrogenase-like Zn-dependent dehydrogenase